MYKYRTFSSGYSKIGIALLVLFLSLVGLGIYTFNAYIQTRQAEMRTAQAEKEKLLSKQAGRISTSSISTIQNTTPRPPGDTTRYPLEFIQPESSLNTQSSTKENSPKTTIRIIAPNGGEKLRVGDVFTLSWSIKNAPEDAWVRIGYLLPATVTGKHGGVWLECIEDVPADSGEYDWDIPDSYSGCGGGEEIVPADMTFASQLAIELFPSEPKCEGDVPENSPCLQGSTRVIASDVSDSYFTVTNKE